MSAAMAGYLGDPKTNVVYSILCIHTICSNEKFSVVSVVHKGTTAVFRQLLEKSLQREPKRSRREGEEC